MRFELEVPFNALLLFVDRRRAALMYMEHSATLCEENGHATCG